MHLHREIIGEAGQHIAHTQHQGGVDDVLAGQAAVQPAGRRSAVR